MTTCRVGVTGDVLSDGAALLCIERRGVVRVGAVLKEMHAALKTEA